MVIGGAGGFLVGFQLGGALVTGGVDNPKAFYLGMGLIVVEVLIKVSASDPCMKKGVKAYNEALYRKKVSRQLDTEE